MAEQIAAAGDPHTDDRHSSRSPIRSGLKREHAFAVRAQADLSPLGRTRSGKTRRISPPVAPGSVAKRVKASKVSGNENVLDFGGKVSGEETEVVVTVDSQPLVEMNPTSACKCSSLLAGSAETAGSSSLSTRFQHQKGQVDFGALEEVCFEKAIAPDDRNELVESVAPIDSRDEELDHSLAIDEQNAIVSACPNELVETAVPINCHYDSMLMESFDNGRSTVSDEDATADAGFQDELKVESNHMTGEEGVRAENSAHTDTRSELKVETEDAVDGKHEPKVDSKIRVGRRRKGRVKNGAGVKTLSRRFTRSLLKSLESSAEVSPADSVKETDSVDVGKEVNVEPVTPGNKFTRFLSKSVEEKKEAEHSLGKGVEEKKEMQHSLVKGVEEKKETEHSLVKGVEEKKETESVSSMTTIEVSSDGSEQVQDPLANSSNCASGPLRETPNKKMELKMSKKIGVTKIPSNCRELIQTGLLDGLTVRYAAATKKKVINGVIQGGGICCSCSLCKGRKTISAYHFELHAGSTKKHPANFICLDNGSSLHDIIKACSRTPLHMLETTIKHAANLDAKDHVLICQQCKTSLLLSRMGRLSLICDDCSMKQPPSNTQRAPSAATKKSTLKDVSSEKKLARRSITTSLGAFSSVPKGSVTTSSASFASINSSKNMPSEMKSTQSQKKMTTKDFCLHKLVFMNDTLPDGTEVAYYTRGKRLLEGYIKGSGIFCRCCNSVVSPSQFEAHAGCAQRKKPYLNIYTSNGVSLHELSVSLSKDKTFSTRENDDLCRICAGDGDLLLCDSCPRSFHKECVGLSAIPGGDWYCPCCESMFQRERYVSCNENAIAAGRIEGVDPIEQIFKRCIRIIQNPDMDASSCVLCRAHDFSKTGFGPRTVLLCDQCEKEFHIGCLKSHNIADLKELPEGEWFCCADCSIVYIELRKFVSSGMQQLPEPLLNVIKNKFKEKCQTIDPDLDVRWQLLNGKMANSDSRSLLSRAVSILQESFDPIFDFHTGQDIIPSMVNGRDVGHQDFGGMYCAVLIVNKTVVSVGLLRVLGLDVAEIPLVATTKESQGQGYFQALFSCMETFLGSLDVKQLVLPATKEAEEIWVKKFGFCEITQSQLEVYTKGSRPMSFQGTPMLHKPVPRSKDPSSTRDV